MLDPDPQYIYYMKAITPIDNWFFLGNLPGGYSVWDIYNVYVDGHFIPSVYWAAEWPGFSCDTIFVVPFPLNTFLAPYQSLTGVVPITYTVSGTYTDMTGYTFTNTVDVYGKDPVVPGKFLTPADLILRGDADASGIVEISDAVSLLEYIFAGGEAPTPRLTGDLDCNYVIEISDVVYLIAYIFTGGDAPCPVNVDVHHVGPTHDFDISELEEHILEP